MLKESMQNRLQKCSERYEEIAALLNTSEVMNDSRRFQDLSKEYAELSELVRVYAAYEQNEAQLREAEILLKDPEMKEMAEEDMLQCKSGREQLAGELYTLLLPKDPNDKAGIFLEIRAAAGGDE